MQIPIANSTAPFTSLEGPNLGTFQTDPDGSRIAYHTNKSISELWALDNVLSVLNTS